MAFLQQQVAPLASKLLCCSLQSAAGLVAPLAAANLAQSLPASTAAAGSSSTQQQQSSSSPSSRCYANSSSSRGYSTHRGLPQLHGTTVLCIRKDGEVVMMADGQITQGAKVVKPNAKKLRRLAVEPQPSLGGFAGSTADGLTLFERLEQKLEEHPGQLRRSAVELAKIWRQDRILRHLEATMIVADATTCLEVSGRGELLEPADGVHAIGSGARFAIAAARALMPVPGLSPFEIAERAMKIAAEKCVYTNSNVIWERIDADGKLQSSSGQTATAGSSNNSSQPLQ